MAKSIDYQNYLIESLSDSEEAAGYLNAALEGGDIQVFLVALHNVIQAQGGMNELAKNSDLLVLARYMQILSPEFIKQYQKNIINIQQSIIYILNQRDCKNSNLYIRCAVQLIQIN